MKTLEQYIAAVESALNENVRRHPRRWFAGFIALVAFILSYSFWFAAPTGFVPDTMVRIPYGTSTPAITQELANANVVAHPALLRFILRISGESDAIQTGVYRFTTPESVLMVAYRLIAGDYGLPPARITFVEGSTVREMAEQITDAFPDITADQFEAIASAQEGYLFPDTYLFSPAADATSIASEMRQNFDAKLTPLLGDISASGHTFSDIITMASLVEKEAHDPTDRRMIAGILWNRLAIDMPLQVDAVFGYINERDTYSPTYADLKVDSPYNTYTHKGLPPGPICNPGLDAIEAALHPTTTEYLYYLTGHDGKMHYSTTYAGHQANQRKYLK